MGRVVVKLALPIIAIVIVIVVYSYALAIAMADKEPVERDECAEDDPICAPKGDPSEWDGGL